MQASSIIKILECEYKYKFEYASNKTACKYFNVQKISLISKIFSNFLLNLLPNILRR